MNTPFTNEVLNSSHINQLRKNKNEQNLTLQSLEYQTIEKEAFKELDQISKKHCIQIFPLSSFEKTQESFYKTSSFLKKSKQSNFNPNKTSYVQESENINSTSLIRSQIKKKQGSILNQSYDSSNIMIQNIKQNTIKQNNNMIKKNWVSPIIQKQNLFNSQKILLQERTNRSSINGNKKLSFQIEAKGQIIHSLEDKKYQIEQSKKINNTLSSNQNNKNQSENNQKTSSVKSQNIRNISLNNLCELPSFNSSFRIQRLNTAAQTSTNSSRNNNLIDKNRSFSSTQNSIFKEPWVKQEFINSFKNNNRINGNSFDFYFYDEQISKLDHLNTEISISKNSIEIKL